MTIRMIPVLFILIFISTEVSFGHMPLTGTATASGSIRTGNGPDKRSGKSSEKTHRSPFRIFSGNNAVSQKKLNRKYEKLMKKSEKG